MIPPARRPAPFVVANKSCLLMLATLLIVAVASTAAEVEEIRLPLLHAPVEVRTDRWGVDHIYAENEHDLFFAQGYRAARSRLFQFELWRRQATGTVAEILGPRAVERDMGARLLRFRGDLQQEFSHYHPRGEQISEAFVEGVNAWIDQVNDRPALLPLEFRVLGLKPQRWTVDVVISRHQGLVNNVTQELELGRAVALLGPERVKEIEWFHPGEPDLTLDEKIDPELLKENLLKLYRAGRSPVEFTVDDVLPEFRAAKNKDRAATGLLPLRRSPADALLAPAGYDERDIGSNNWVVSGARTESGSPIMANDPHRVVQAPSLRYFVHLSAPGWNVIGGGEPTLPGCSIGHNEHGAWGLTIYRIDAEDLRIYELNSDNPLEYRYGQGWERMTVVRETIPVKGQDAIDVELKFTRHGPVLYHNAERGAAVALQAGWLDVGAAPYLASLRMNGAGTWEDFRDACSYSRLPGLNMVWADRQGNIGWQTVGVAPLRRRGNGLVPTPGDGRYDWDGYLPIKALPNVANPVQGFWNTSNENKITADHESRHAVGWNWADPYRGARVHEVLAAGRKLNMMDMMRLQQDELSIPARTLVPLLRDLQADSTTVNEAISLLRDWDFVLDRDSVPAGIYVAWERRLADSLAELMIPKAARPHFGSLSMKRMIDWLLSPDNRLGDDPLAGRDRLLLTSLTEAIERLTEKFGPDMNDWRYGQADYKHALLRHPLSPVVNDALREKLEVGPLPRGGNGYTVNNTGGSDNQPTGATFRIIVDTADWDLALATNSPGQSGDPESPHYSDLFEMWATGRYFPLLYSRGKVESATGAIAWMKPRGNDE